MLREITYRLRKYFSATSHEIYGVFLLLLLTLVTIYAINAFDKHYIDDGSTPFFSSEDQAMLERVVAQWQIDDSLSRRKNVAANDAFVPVYEHTQTTYTLKPFDPNTASEQVLSALGLSTKVVSNILKYRKKGGSFRKKDDLDKIYGLARGKFLELRPFIMLSNVTRPAESSTTVSKKKLAQQKENDTKKSYAQRDVALPLSPFDINSADTATLKRIRGIGTVLSNRIVKFREKLGGFHSIEQVRDVYNLDEKAYKEVARYVYVETSALRKIKINHISEGSLAQHPYISKKLATHIIELRNRKRIESIAALKKVVGINLYKLELLAPYLDFEE